MTRAPSPRVAAVALAAAFLLGVLAGRGTAPPADAVAPRGPGAPPGPAPPPGAPRARLPGAPPPPGSPPWAPPAPRGPHGPHGRETAPAAPVDTRAEAAGRPDVALDLGPALAAARAAAAGPDDEHAQEAAQAAAGWLDRALAADPNVLAQAVARLRSLEDPAELAFLAAVLGRFADPAVEEAALDLALRDAHGPRRLAALDVLDAIDSPRAREVALGLLQRERDVDLRRAALRALPEPLGASADEAGPVVDTLLGVLARDADPELRRRAAASLGRWHRSDADLAHLLARLAQEPDPVVRAACAFGCEVAQRRTPAVLSALVLALRDPDPVVRENALHALASLAPLPPDVHAAYAAAREEHVARTEAGE